MSVRDWTLVECRAGALRRVLRPSLGTPCYCIAGRKPLVVGGSTCSYSLSANRNGIFVRALGQMRNTYQVDVAAFNELDEEEDSDSVRCLTHPETVERPHEGNSGSD